MGNQSSTFNEFGLQTFEKEDIEWMNIWCEHTNDESLPRVALVGDSITQQSFQAVQKELKGLALVDYFVTSYSLLSPAYEKMLTSFLSDSKYAVVCYNYGLHGYGIDGVHFNDYGKECIAKSKAGAIKKVLLSEA